MHIIAHRRNTITDLQNTNSLYGVEVDIRSYGDELIIHHDPYIRGESFTKWLAHYRHGTLILNIKEEGLEHRLIQLMKDHHIDNYFFLDQSFPFLIKWSRLGERRCAIRVSEYESVKTALTLAGKVDWVWVDCFTHLALTAADAHQLNIAGFKLCLVSPELQGREPLSEIPAMQQYLAQYDIRIDAVCTKRPDLWEMHQ